MTSKAFVAGMAMLNAVLAVAPARAQSAPAEEFMTGAEAISESEYDTLPKLEKFRAFLPKAVDLTNAFPKPGHQGRQPNCVAWATTYAARSFLYGQNVGHQPARPEDQMSPAYVYNRLRKPGSMCDKAIRIVDALNFLKNEGSVTLSDFPDDITKCPLPAPETLKTKASRYRLTGWRAVERERKGGLGRATVVLDDLKGSLYRGEPIVFAMPVLEDFKALKGADVYRHAEPASSNLHAMTVIGYDEGRQAFRVLNSWGTTWGDQGYAWIDYQTFKLLVTEAYALQDDPARKAAAPAPTQSAQDLLAALAVKLPCGTATVAMEGKRVAVTGFSGDAAALAQLKRTAIAADPKVEWRMTHRPWPQCEAELTLTQQMAKQGVRLIAQSADGRTRAGDPIQMRAGEFFGISADVAAGQSHLSLIYLQADGSAVELFRGQVAPPAQGKHSVTVGLSGDAAARFRVAAPFGDEVIIALAADRPIFGDELKDFATEREFLTALRAKLSGPFGETVSAAVVRLRTKP